MKVCACAKTSPACFSAGKTILDFETRFNTDAESALLMRIYSGSDSERLHASHIYSDKISWKSCGICA
jgi:hypothetical protein